MRAALVAAALVAVACGGSGSPTITAPGSTTSETVQGIETTSTLIDGTTSTIVVATPVDGACPVVATAGGPYALTEMTAAAGLDSTLIGLHGHAAAWGDVTGDGMPDLFVGTFADRPPQAYAHRGADGPNPDRLLTGAGSAFSLVESFSPELGRTSGAAFADLDNDGDLDLVATRNAGNGEGARAVPTTVFRNDSGVLVETDAGFDAGLGGRSVGVIDYDQDGLADLFISEDRYRGGSSRLYRNLGELRFEDVTAAVGIPLDVNGLGVAIGDVSGDLRPDIFVAGSNRLLVSDGDGFVEADNSVFQWEVFGNEDILTGVDIADVNLDGRLDLIVGHHYNSTVDFDTEVSVRLYLNRTDGDSVRFEDVTDAAGLVPLPTKAPHVEFADMNNDGLLDIVTSASAQNGTVPAIFLGASVGDVPTFDAPEGLGSDQYWVTAPTADVDRDGRLDVLAVEWEPSLPSLFFAGDSDGNWVSIGLSDVAASPGSLVSVYAEGGLDDPSQLLAHRPLTASKGYTAGSELLVHVGLADRTAVDVVVTSPDGTRYEARGLAANALYRLPGGCG